MQITVGIVVITKSQAFFDAGVTVLNDIKDYVFQSVDIDTQLKVSIRSPVLSPVYEETRTKAIDFLRSRKETINIEVIQAEDIKDAAIRVMEKERLKAASEESSGTFQMGMLYYDQSSLNTEDDSIEKMDRDLLQFYRTLDEAGIASFYSPFSTVSFIQGLRDKIRYLPQQSLELVLPDDLSVLQTQLLCLWMDFFEMNYINRRVKPKGETHQHNTLGEQLLHFFAKHAADGWVCSYYTGSIVSNLIGYIDKHAESFCGQTLRGPNEHSLACGALANWQLYEKPSLTIVTSAMVDEFKGTLANLREANARGIIIVAENRTNQWYSFQGTITPTEDTREVLKARRVPYVYMEDLDTLATDLEKAFTAYYENRGPVVLLVTQKVLEAGIENNTLIAEKCAFEPVAFDTPDDDQKSRLDEAVQLINEGPEKILWQLGALTEREKALVTTIAEQAGIGLVDSLIHPGSSSKFNSDKRNPNYLGTLSIYGFSPKVYNFLYTNDKINPVSDQSLFFIKSRISQVCTPFSEGRFDRKIHVVQVTHNPVHMAPFTDLPLQMDSTEFLEVLSARLNVPDTLREKRMAHINALYDSPSDIVSKIPSTPMSPNYFFQELGVLLEDMITHKGYDYTGIYDVGRCGISAIRNLPCTRRGFSGWYGRALMGDALLATGFVAHTSPSNILAFIGDGAKGIVPDILPSFIENLLSTEKPLNKNITVMFFCNGGLSVINTYQERILFNRTSKQMRLVNLEADEWEETICGFKVCAKNITSFDGESLEAALTEPNRLNLFSVTVSHNNEGDGITLATAKGWQRDPAYSSEVKYPHPKQISTENNNNPLPTEA